MPVTLGGFAVIDIIAAAIILIFAIIGLARGFMKQILSFVGGLVVVVCAFLSFKYVYDFLYGLGFFKGWVDGLGEKMAGVNWSFLQKLAENAGITVGQFLSECIFKLAVFIIICIIYGLVFKLIKVLLVKIAKLPVIKIFDKILGFILGAAWGVVFLLAALFILNLLQANVAPVKTFMETYITPDSYLNTLLVSHMPEIQNFFVNIFNFIKGKVDISIG